MTKISRGQMENKIDRKWKKLLNDADLWSCWSAEKRLLYNELRELLSFVYRNYGTAEVRNDDVVDSMKEFNEKYKKYETMP